MCGCNNPATLLSVPYILGRAEMEIDVLDVWGLNSTTTTPVPPSHIEREFVFHIQQGSIRSPAAAHGL